MFWKNRPSAAEHIATAASLNDVLQFRLHEKTAQQYRQAQPYAHIVMDDFVQPNLLASVHDEFPPDLMKASRQAVKFEHPLERKLASSGEALFGPTTLALMRFFNSAPFLHFLSEITGIDNLIPDPTFSGGGMHQIQPGGYLKLHADFNKHPDTGLDRRLNLLLYLNRDWRKEWGGDLQLWDQDVQNCVQSVLPEYNRAVLFSTRSDTFHGHPDPLGCPPSRTRNSLALYYFSHGRPESEIDPNESVHNTRFRLRPGEQT